MGYTDADGFPELVMHPDIKRGAAAFRVLDEPEPGADDDPASENRRDHEAGDEEPLPR